MLAELQVRRHYSATCAPRKPVFEAIATSESKFLHSLIHSTPELPRYFAFAHLIAPDQAVLSSTCARAVIAVAGDLQLNKLDLLHLILASRPDSSFSLMYYF